MQKVSSIIEIQDTDNLALKVRSSLIERDSGLGPPDQCFVVREHLATGLKKLLSKSQNKSYYHYIYGVDTSSISSIAAYFKHFLDSFNKKVSGNRVIFACFCTFDLFSKMDLRVEIEFPGKITAFLINHEGCKFDPLENHWKGAYLSSALRFCYPITGTAVGYIEQFKKLSDIEAVFHVAVEFSERLGFVLGDLDDTLKYKHNLLLPAISRFLLKRKRYKIHQEIIKKFIDKDPLMLTFLGKSSIEIGKLDEIIQLTSNQIKITPHAFPLYYTAACAYLKRGDTHQALTLSQYLVELNLEVYKYWELLVLCYIKLQDFPSAVLCFNFLPHYDLQEAPSNLPSNSPVLPYEKISFAATANIWNIPKTQDFKPFEEFNYAKSRKEKQLIFALDALPGKSLSGSKQRAFKLLAKIEKLIEWNNLLKITKEVFRTDPVAEKEVLYSKFSSMGGDYHKSGFTRSMFQASQDFVADPVIDNYIQPVQMLTCRDYFLQDSRLNRLASMMSPQRRVQNEDTIQIFNAMNFDLKTIYEWQKESSDIFAVHAAQSKKEQNSDIPYSGDLWIRRGALSERLLRNRQAERAYRYVVDKGFSLFSWYRLMVIYTKAGNPKAVLVCIVELLKQMENEDVFFESLPPWIDILLGKLCKGCGFKQIFSLGEEIGIKKVPALFTAVERLKYWRTDGVNDS